MSADTDLSFIGEKIKQNEVEELKNSDFISDITSRKFEFVSVIKSLNDILTNQDVTVRERGVDFLSWILMEVSPSLFNGREISAIVNFYCARLKDHPSLASATINGLLALVKMKNIENESLVQILMPLFRETDCQVLDKTDRYNIFSIVAYLVDNHFEVVVTMGFDFVFGIISIADGETDPLNLLLLFRFLPTFLKNINLGHLMEETFDLLSCYFPIDYDTTFRNTAVTREELSEGLMNCLIAKSDFADLCISLIFDKLSSTVRLAKIDSYRLLQAGCSTFSLESVSKHSNEIWKTMQKDVLPPTDTNVRDSALNALSEVVKLYASSESDLQPLKIFLDAIITNIKDYLHNVGNSMFRPAVRILMAVSSKSIVAAKYVIGHLRFMFNEDTSRIPRLRKIALLSLSPFLPIMKACDIAHSDESVLVTLFNQVSRFYINALDREHLEIQRLAVLGLQELIDDFDDDLREQVLQALVHVLIPLWDEDRTEFYRILRKLARQAPDKMLNFVRNFEIRKDFDGELDLKPLMFTLSAVAGEEKITRYAIPRLIQVMSSTSYFYMGISYLLKSVKLADDNQFLKKIHTDYNFIKAIVTEWLKATAHTEPIENSCIEHCCEMTAFIVRCQETSVQQSIIDKFIPRLMPGLESGSCQSNLFLIEAIINSVEDLENFVQLYRLGSRAITLALKSNDEQIRLSSSRLLGSIGNKMSENLPRWFPRACDDILSSLDEMDSVSERERAVYLLGWIVKGLILSDSPYLRSIIPKWFDLLEREDIGLDVARGFKTVLDEEELYLNTKSRCTVKVLYRQKFFTYFPILMDKYESSRSPYRSNYLLALVRLIESVPKHVAATEMTNIVIVLSQTLDTGYPKAIFACTTILEEYLRNKEAILVNYIYTFIPKLLNLSQLYGRMEIRISALRCLFFYAFYPTVSILPLRREVIKSLQTCLDDRKRLVRSEAVRSRNRWFLVGAPGEDTVFS